MQAKNYAAQILTDIAKGKIAGTILDKCSDDKQVAIRRIETIAEGLKSAIHFNLPDFGTILGNERKGETLNILDIPFDQITISFNCLSKLDILAFAYRADDNFIGVICFFKYRFGYKIVVNNLDTKQASYLERMDLFDGVDLLCDLPANRRHDCRNKLVELKCIDNHDKVDESSHMLADALIGRSGLDKNAPYDEMTCLNNFDRAKNNLQYSFSELLENSLTHARKNGRENAKVWVASQYYQNGNLRIGIVDNGCGFLGSLHNHVGLVTKTHESAIALALEPYISCNRELDIVGACVNEGVGLTTTHNLINLAKGKIVIASGDCCRSNGRSVILSDKVSWSGVAIGIECSRGELIKVSVRDALPPRRDIKRVLHTRFI